MITFTYRNYKGECEVRKIKPWKVEFLPNPGFGYQPGWYLTGYDQERDGAVRSFFLPNIVLPNNREIFKLAEWENG